MSLLETASLIVTPNAYKEGKLYSVIPSDGSGDMSVVRATTATRVNSAGLVELVPYNLIPYSQDFSNAVWNKLSQGLGSVPIITPNYATAPDGTQTATRFQCNLNGGNDGSSRSWMTLLFNPISTVNMSIYIKLNSAGSKTIVFSESGGSYQTITNTEWQRINVTQLGGLGEYRIGLIGGISSDTLDCCIWGAQVNEGSTALPYLKTETRLNIPRLDYSLGGCPSILLEPQRTNLATYSEQFDDASWNKINSSITANADISPDGYTNADRIYDNATSGQHRVGKNISVVSATTYTFSVFAKKGSLRYCYLLTTAGGASDRYYFDLQDGVSITAGGKIEDYGSGWYRISAQVTAAATGNELFAFNLTDSSSFPTYLGTGTGYHMIYGYQVEAGNYQTSYIPTTSASVTRNQDLMLLSNIYTNNLLTSSGGTWFVDFRNNVPLSRDSVVRFGLGDTSAISLNAMYFIGGASNGRLIIQKRVAGAVTTLYTTTADTCKIAFKWNGATMDIFENGFKVIADSVFTSTDLNFFNGIAATPYFISSMLLAPTPLTDDECIQLTTI
jgi:hypothetical protein